jgi:PAS domain
MADARDPIARLKDKIEKSGWGLSVDETMTFAKPELTILFDLWRLKADTLRALPRREDLDIRLLKPFLRHISVVERIANASGKSSYRIRLQGSFLVEFFGDQTGKLLEESVPPELAERWTGVYDALLEAGRPLRLQGTYQQERMEYLVGESLNVPLGNGEGPPVSVLSATYYTPRYLSET